MDENSRTTDRTRLLAAGCSPRDAQLAVEDELMLDGSAMLNLATFVTTWMDPEGRAVMASAADKNAIDKDEYPSTARMESWLVSMVAHLFHAPGLVDGDAASATGVATIGSSEAVMLAGLALKWRWRAARGAAGADASRPELVVGTNVQVVWEKFCRYFDVEPVYLPMAHDRYVVDPEQVRAAVNENTIGVVGILGTTFTGEYEDIAGIARVLDEVADAGGPDVPIHVDAASGGFVAPFLDPHLEWDFRVERVASINVSGHKYGLTFPGIGFTVWREPAALPAELVFHVDYLGGDMPTFTLNFSKPGSQIAAQFYVFLRYGVEGFHDVMAGLRETAMELARHIGGIPEYELVTDGSALPVLAFSVGADAAFTVYDVSHELRACGWQVPAYPLPADAQDVHVLRVVVRHGFSSALAERFAADLDAVTARLRAVGTVSSTARSFAHLGIVDERPARGSRPDQPTA